MAVIPVTSNYNVRRRKQGMGVTVVQPLSDSPRLQKKQKIEKRGVFTPPASPEVIDSVSIPLKTSQQVQDQQDECYEDDHDDAVLMGILDYMRRIGGSAVCSREISEGPLAEGKVPLVGATPTTLVDSAIKQHHKRCTSSNRSNIIQKISDPRFPRKTLYHLANADPFAPRRAIAVQPKPDANKPAKAIVQRKREYQQRQQVAFKHESSDDASDSDSAPANELGALVNDCQGPFAASFDTRRRISLSPSDDDLDFSLSIDDVACSVASPPEVSSPEIAPTGPQIKEALHKSLKTSSLNIALPPSPFIAPQDKEEVEHDQSMKLSSSFPHMHALTDSPITRTRGLFDDDFYDVEVQSPEAVSLDDLDHLLGF